MPVNIKVPVGYNEQTFKAVYGILIDYISQYNDLKRELDQNRITPESYGYAVGRVRKHFTAAVIDCLK